jgi:hypothetical protein
MIWGWSNLECTFIYLAITCNYVVLRLAYRSRIKNKLPIIFTAYCLRVPRWIASFTFPNDPTPISFTNLNSVMLSKYPLGLISICIYINYIIYWAHRPQICHLLKLYSILSVQISSHFYIRLYFILKIMYFIYKFLLFLICSNLKVFLRFYYILINGKIFIIFPSHSF